jgi:hypothetical protein
MTNPLLTKLAAEAHVEDLRRVAARVALRREAAAPLVHARVAPDVVITIRLALPEDASALARLAELDSAQVPSGRVLIAEADGQLRAALSLRDGATVADPFHATAAAVQLLTVRAAELCGEPRWRSFLLRAMLARQLRRGRPERVSLMRST